MLNALAYIFIFILLTYLLFLKRRSLFVLLVLQLLMEFVRLLLFAILWLRSSSYFHQINIFKITVKGTMHTACDGFCLIIKSKPPSLSSSSPASQALSSSQSSSPSPSSSSSSSSSSRSTFGLKCLHCLQLLDHWRECVRDHCHLHQYCCFYAFNGDEDGEKREILGWWGWVGWWKWQWLSFKKLSFISRLSNNYAMMSAIMMLMILWWWCSPWWKVWRAGSVQLALSAWCPDIWNA